MREIIKTKWKRKISKEELDKFKTGFFKFSHGKGKFYKYFKNKVVLEKDLFDNIKLAVDTMLVDKGYLITGIKYVDLEAVVEKNIFNSPFDSPKPKEYEKRNLFLIIYDVEVYKSKNR